MALSKTMKTCIVFIVGYSAKRDGLPEDIDTITTTFKELFNAEIYNWTDLDKDKLKHNLKQLTKDSWRNAFRNIDFVVTFCLAHGREEGVVEFPDGIQSVRKLLLPPLFQISELDGKLKWLVLQTCRGRMNGPPMQRDGRKNYYTDFYFISYCTGDATVSWQEGRSGKIYINSICEELRQNAPHMNLFEISKRVNTRISEYARGQIYESIAPVPDIHTNCEDDFFFGHEHKQDEKEVCPPAE